MGVTSRMAVTLSPTACNARSADLREPLNPSEPAEDHDTALPCASVMVTIVLLNVAFTWATPVTTFFFSFLRGRGAAFAIYFTAFFLPAIARAGPLRVRALVWV